MGRKRIFQSLLVSAVTTDRIGIRLAWIERNLWVAHNAHTVTLIAIGKKTLTCLPWRPQNVTEQVGQGHSLLWLVAA